MIDSGTGDLTGPAKTILTKPTFLPDAVGEAAAYGGAEEATGALLASSGLLGTAASALGAFGLGVGVGTLICHAAGIEGCLFSSADSADSVPESGSWVWKVVPQEVGDSGPGPGLSWYAYQGGSIASIEAGYNGAPTSGGCYVAPITGISGFVSESEPFYNCKDSEGVKHPVPKARFYRYGMANRTLSHLTDAQAETAESEGLVDSRVEPSTEGWSEDVASALAGQEGTSAARMGEKVASEIGGSGVSDPYAVTVTVPSCSGEAWVECKEDLEELELVPERSTLTWETAKIELEPDAVTELSPSPETEVETGTKVVVTTNPAEADMPVVVPAPKGGETYDEYIERLAPQLAPSRVNVGEASIDPSVGPNAVIRTDPVGGTRLNPEGEHSLEVQTNPSTAPAPGAGVGEAGSCNATVGSVDFTPLNQPVGSRFPFGVVGFFIGWIGEWSGEAFEDPEFTFTVIPAGVFGSEKAAQVTLDLETVEPAMEAVRIAFLLVSFVGLLWFLGTAAMKVQGDAS